VYAASGSVTLRQAAKGDRPFIEALSSEAFGDFDRFAGAHTAQLLRGAGVTLVAEYAGELAGFVVVELQKTRGTAHVQAIAVRRDHRGRGIGRRLLLAAENVARTRGAGALHLTTAQANVEALALFLKCGFRIERRMERFYPRGQDACYLIKPLG
jgi:ribosomal protein S18 acetylase RimI-like enzyme